MTREEMLRDLQAVCEGEETPISLARFMRNPAKMNDIRVERLWNQYCKPVDPVMAGYMAYKTACNRYNSIHQEYFNGGWAKGLDMMDGLTGEDFAPSNEEIACARARMAKYEAIMEENREAYEEWKVFARLAD